MRRLGHWASVFAIIASAGVAQAQTDGNSSASEQLEEPPGPVFALGFNLVQFLLETAGSTAVKDSSLVTVPIETHASFGGIWGLGGSLLIRSVKDGLVRYDTGFALGIGPRLGFFGDGVEGMFLTVKLGVGYAAGKNYQGQDYNRVDLLVQPEIGYAFAWGAPGFFLGLGAGLRSLIPVSENPGSLNFNAIGKLLHYYTPLINGTVGFDI